MTGGHPRAGLFTEEETEPMKLTASVTLLSNTYR
jgi:hypothetical protein